MLTWFIDCINHACLFALNAISMIHHINRIQVINSYTHASRSFQLLIMLAMLTMRSS